MSSKLRSLLTQIVLNIYLFNTEKIYTRILIFTLDFSNFVHFIFFLMNMDREFINFDNIFKEPY